MEGSHREINIKPHLSRVSFVPSMTDALLSFGFQMAQNDEYPHNPVSAGY